MVGCRRHRILAARRHAHEVEEARHTLGEKREILGAGDERYGAHVGAPRDALQARQHSRGQLRIIAHHRVAARVDLEARGGAARRRGVFHEATHVVDNFAPLLRIKGADGADHLHIIGHDVVADTALDRTDCHDCGIRRDVGHTAHDGLQTVDDLCRHDHRVDAAPGSRAMGLPTLDDNTVGIRTRHQRTAAIADHAGRHVGEDVQPEHGLRSILLKHAFLDHQACATFFTDRCTLFCGLEEEHHRTRKFALHRDQRFGKTHQDGGVCVVSAGVHHADGFIAVGCGRFRAERHVCLFDHRQRIHVRAQGNRRPRAPALQHAHHRCLGDAGLDL